MAGNSQRRGATRKTASKKGASAGTGGKGRKALEGRGPTPKASERTGHPAARRAEAAKRREQAQPKRPRAADRSDIVTGRNPVLEALRTGMPARSLEMMTGLDADDRVREIRKIAAFRSLPVVGVSRPELERRGIGVHQGVVLHVEPYEYLHPDELLEVPGDPLIVALDGVTDPHNLGAVIRSAAAFGADGVLIPERRSAGVTATAWKVSAGALSRCPVARATNLVRALESYREAGCFVVGLDADGASAIGEVELLAGPVVLVLGSEGRGLSRLVRETCDVLANIPIDAGTESLNASVAAGIALYEAARHRA